MMQRGSKPILHRMLRLVIVAVCLSFAQLTAATAQTNAPAPLPPAAQEAVNKGMVAAKLPDYPLAIRYFEEARKLAPLAPVIFMNLGIAESKMPGRELRAMAWFGAYLAAFPDAPNAVAVKEQIAMLDVRNQSNISRFIKTAQEAAYHIPDYARTQRLNDVAKLWTKAGDLPAAVKAAESHTIGSKSAAYSVISGTQAEGGDIAGAQKTADRIQDTFEKGLAQRAIAKAQAGNGDFAAATKTINLIQDANLKRAGQSEIAGIREKAGVANPPGSTGLSTSVEPVTIVADWLRKLDDNERDRVCSSLVVNSCDRGLNIAHFLDLAGQLKSLPRSTVPIEIYDGLSETAHIILDTRNVVHQMLKRQAIR
jgi:tetratricopeptide (TPR) repeat protein